MSIWRYHSWFSHVDCHIDTHCPQSISTGKSFDSVFCYLFYAVLSNWHNGLNIDLHVIWAFIFHRGMLLQAQQPCRLVKPNSLPLAGPLPPRRLLKPSSPSVQRRNATKPRPRPTSYYQHPPHFHYLDPTRISYPSYSFIRSSRRLSTPSSATSRCTTSFPGPLPILKPHRLTTRTMATAVQQSPLSTERFERTTFAEPAHVRIETTTTTTVITRERDGDQYYTVPRGFPGGAANHNPPIIRVVQKPIEA